MTKARRLARGGALVVAATVVLAACAPAGGVQAQQAPQPQRRSNVVAPTITMTTPRVEVSPGARIRLVARAAGGEALLFSVDWRVTEGSAGGQVEAGARADDGTYAATYTAPAAGGTFHVTATLHEYPAATAATEVRVTPR